MKAVKTTLHTMTRRKRSPPSRPWKPTAAAAMARFCGEIILPSTPPEELAAAMRVGGETGLVGGGDLEGAEQGVGGGVGAGDGNTQPAEDR